MKRGYDKVYGARPMARAIDDLIKKPMVDELLFGRLTKGGRVFISLKDQALSFDYQAHTLSLDAPVKV
jgi:ATP-dependent Clp protease ATP-binding subunit ClpA